ncbi:MULTISPECIES: heavy metal translocating P-type ATPase [Moraxella]|uniref:ATPase n=1 Tax=Moraxella lacunata TaxID=477 RepID=A0A1B8Q7J1_MORLA|nr:MULTISPECIES: heavy metal translocating P-type ATPase [Moraxella]MBE9579576.1 heavy metal translocating P-type ATPase [Moraxella sp. K1664]MBE9589102.1 heavy metal translocating P-type ATPase [Moraxella sp. K1630]MBE9591109.1 heavy metal translocating P-type ATPase [Moraxella sp. K127]MBE9597367.1 heavy metal translocating P-type ATPase [Moraxella sp. K2450]MDH9219898.1 heavy metal translocating P-type ATPase [Moraxella lacunata]
MTDTPQDPIDTSLVLPPDGHCFHCGEKLPSEPFFTVIFDKPRPMCCLGCQLASESIVELGLSQYYLDRREISPTAPLPLANFDAYNHDDVKAQFVYREDGASTAELSVTDLRCTACTWLIETRLRGLDGVRACQVNLTQQRMRVNWDESRCSIGDILGAVHSVGYDARPYRQDTHEAMMKRQNKQMLIRLGVAAVGAMQAMMFSIGLYFGDYSGMADEHRHFLRAVALFVTMPVIFYAGVPFFRSAYNAIKARQVNMDVPVSIALIVTFGASLYATLTQSGETYFDSVSMFIFFLLAGRYIEQNARLKASNMASDLVVIEPVLIKRLGHSDELIAEFANGSLDNELIKDWRNAHASHDVADDGKVLAQALTVGDVIWVEAGQQIACDGVLLSESATVSQSLLTGESDLIVKKQGDTLAGGSQNDAQPFVMLVTAQTDDSQMALIDRLMNRAMSEKPQIAQDADRMARWFVARVLVLSVLIFVIWLFVDKTQALWATVAVLVATCPCALSLATPIALTMATNRLASLGFLATRGHTIQSLSEVSHVAFDKTGTLTVGQANLLHVDYTTHDKTHWLKVGASLEVGSKHPVARAILTSAHGLHLPKVQNATHHTAGGVEGCVDGVWYRIGHDGFVLNGGGGHVIVERLDTFGANMSVALSVKAGESWDMVARFYFNDVVRTDAKQTIDNLKKQGITPLMLTGDPSDNALTVAQTLGIEHAYHGLSPTDKVNHIKELQKDGHTVLMVGDGINDAPVLGASNVSVAMAGASDLAQVSADGVLLDGRLSIINHTINLSIKTHQIIRQNLRWALVYNTLILVPAGMGYVPPWLAAIGMSLSSLFVVANAMRIKRS